MEITLTAPALLFPAVSLLMLAYTNRFLALANLIRGLSAKYKSEHQEHQLLQINNLRLRIVLIRNMQALGILSLIFAVLSMMFIFFNRQLYGKYAFAAALLLMLLSLIISFRETLLSGKALEFELKEIEKQ
jgi:hypothetical protein